MKTELNAPITYDSQNKKYFYERECELNLRTGGERKLTIFVR